MFSSSWSYIAVVMMIMVSGSQACTFQDDPCDFNQCCYLLFNFGPINFSFCSNRNVNNDRCAQVDYCLSNNDCPGTQECQGADIFNWGRCSSANCVKKVQNTDSQA